MKCTLLWPAQLNDVQSAIVSVAIEGPRGYFLVFKQEGGASFKVQIQEGPGMNLLEPQDAAKITAAFAMAFIRIAAHEKHVLNPAKLRQWMEISGDFMKIETDPRSKAPAAPAVRMFVALNHEEDRGRRAE